MNYEKVQQDLIRDESLQLKPYRCPAGKLTIGVGRNIEDNGITRDEAMYLLDRDIARCVKDLDRSLPWWRDLSDARQNALVNMCFNLGISRLCKFERMLGALRDGDWETAWAEALGSKWAEQVGDRAMRIAQIFKGA